MIKNNLLLFLFVFISFAHTGCKKDSDPKPGIPPIENPGTSDSEKIAKAKWETIKVSEAVIWKYYHFSSLFNAKQSVTVFDIDLNNNKLKIDIPFVKSGFLKTSEGGASVKATAAINGGYFDTNTGGSTVFFKKDNEIINPTKSGFTTYRENAGMAIDESGKVSIIKKPASGWHSASAKTMLVSGPLLMLEGKIIEQEKQVFNTNRHPRTAVGLTKNNHLISVVVDGRTNESFGMTTTEMAEVMKALGCISAMNFDGGGSSTAWIKNRGVVNYPCDNSKFDHEGERGVATVIAFIDEN